MNGLEDSTQALVVLRSEPFETAELGLVSTGRAQNQTGLAVTDQVLANLRTLAAMQPVCVFIALGRDDDSSFGRHRYSRTTRDSIRGHFAHSTALLVADMINLPGREFEIFSDFGGMLDEGHRYSTAVVKKSLRNGRLCLAVPSAGYQYEPALNAGELASELQVDLLVDVLGAENEAQWPSAVVSQYELSRFAARHGVSDVVIGAAKQAGVGVTFADFSGDENVFARSLRRGPVRIV